MRRVGFRVFAFDWLGRTGQNIWNVVGGEMRL
jgi:hypothetical protein